MTMIRDYHICNFQLIGNDSINTMLRRSVIVAMSQYNQEFKKINQHSKKFWLHNTPLLLILKGNDNN